VLNPDVGLVVLPARSKNKCVKWHGFHRWRLSAAQICLCAEWTFAVSPLWRVFEAGGKANGGMRKVKHSRLAASALGIWRDPGHS